MVLLTAPSSISRRTTTITSYARFIGVFNSPFPGFAPPMRGRAVWSGKFVNEKLTLGILLDVRVIINCQLGRKCYKRVSIRAVERQPRTRQRQRDDQPEQRDRRLEIGAEE